MEATRTLTEGQTYMLDDGSGGLVKLVKKHGEVFCKVRSLESKQEWDTMLCRLSEPDYGKLAVDLLDELDTVLTEAYGTDWRFGENAKLAQRIAVLLEKVKEKEAGNG